MDRHLSLAPRFPRRLAGCLVALGLALGLPAGPAHGQSCKADPAWFKPGAPPEPDPEKPRDTNCDFHQWAVQELLYQVQTVGDRARFLSLASPHALFLYSGDKPEPYPGKTTLFKLGAGMARLRSTGKTDALPLVFLPRTVKTPDTTFDEPTQAGSNAVLVDQNGQWVYYTASINKRYYDFVLRMRAYSLEGLLNLPRDVPFDIGSLETKSSWRIAVKDGVTYIPDASKSFYTIDAPVCKDEGCKSLVPATMALVGLHLVGLVKGHPEMIWATFEHNLNAPDCKNTRSADPRYSFYKAGQNCGTAPDWENCNKASTDKTTPSEICRLHPQGEPGTSPENTPNIEVLNESFHQQLPEGSIWRNYDYAGATWTTGDTSGGLIVLSDSAIRGSTKLANTSLESFTQRQSCFGCHITSSYQMGTCIARERGPKNVYISHLFGLICKRPKLLASH